MNNTSLNMRSEMYLVCGHTPAGKGYTSYAVIHPVTRYMTAYEVYLALNNFQMGLPSPSYEIHSLVDK